jgi:hypothetical protein
MTVLKTLVCLANSRKLSGRCVAGIAVEPGNAEDWIRPVSDRPTREVSEREREYEDGSDPKILDFVTVPLIKPYPQGYQQENWLLDPKFYWMRHGRAGWDDLIRLEQLPQTLWVNGFRTYHGVNDRVPDEEAEKLSSSLTLIRVKALRLLVHVPGSAFGDAKRVVRAIFHYGDAEYALRVTDPTYERSYLARSNGTYGLGESFLTVSMGEPYDGFAYKLVAAIIERAVVEGADGDDG